MHRKKNKDRIFSEIKKEEKELNEIRDVILSMKRKVLDKAPSHFSKRDIINAIFGSLVVGLTFVLKGGIIQTAQNLTLVHIEFIILFTLLILMAQIYFIGYSRIDDKSDRSFGEFMTKRLVTLYGISLIISFFLVYIFNINMALPDFYNTMKMVVLLSMPSAVGAAVPNLLKQY
jgi:uncharacterized membrane protein